MADVENQPDSSFPVKRKSDLFCQDQDNVANKAQKLNPNSADSESKDGDFNGSGIENLNSSTEEKIGAETEISLEKAVGSESERDENGVAGDLGCEQEQEGGDIDEEEEEEEDENEEDEEIEPETYRKGKGISREDKGKGKLIEVDESDDEDDSDDDEEGGDEDDESDFSDDPLAEVDLGNILPSRTRRRSIQPGVYISNEISNQGGNNDEDDDSSDDSDA